MIEKIKTQTNNSNNLFYKKNKSHNFNYNTRQFYDKHPDLMPRDNLLLYLGRVISKEEIDKQFNKTFKPTFFQKAKNWLKNTFNKVIK